ncbi:hypothetical protein AB1Y20_003810 [Prymnesium parvum]|uniref:Lengsin n=1 Tax=Prymnesium parvum TaxID=97485 RepID=A0AB34J5R9_PRYPA
MHPAAVTLIAASIVASHVYLLRRLHARASPPPSKRSNDASSRRSVPLTRDLPLVPSEAALLVIDMQNYCCHPRGGLWSHGASPSAYYLATLPSVLGNIRALLAAARRSGLECLFSTIESLTADGRDRSLDYKISQLHVPRGAWDGRVVDVLAPLADEIVLPKCSSSVFCSTKVAYKLRNLGVRQLVLVGGLTDQCIDSAVRDACDEGFLVTVVSDACVTHSEERHRSSLNNNRGYCRQVTTIQLLTELANGEEVHAPAPCREWQELWENTGSSSHLPMCDSGHGAVAEACEVEAAKEGRGALEELEREGGGHAAPPACGSSRHYVRFEVIDMNGKALSKLIPWRHRHAPVELYAGAIGASANSEAMSFPAEIAAAGFPNALLVAEWSTWQPLPWAARHPVVISRVYCEQRAVDGRLTGAVPRTACRRQLAELEATTGLLLYSACELEFGVAHADTWDPAFGGVEIFSTLQLNKVLSFCCAVEEALETVGIDVRTINPEYGEGQLEITFSPHLGVAAADAAATFRTAVKEIAQQQGMLATFLAKPFGTKGAGNGGHFNFSLWQRETGGGTEAGHGEMAGLLSAQNDPDAADGLSSTARHFLAGVLAHASALEAFCSPTPACYLRHGNWAPTLANYGPDDRTCAVRVKPGSHFELRMPSASACGYLVLAAVAAAGRDGVMRKLTLPPTRQNEAEGASLLPRSICESLSALEADEYMCSALGDELVRWFIGMKRCELQAIERRITRNEAEGKSKDEAQLEAWRYFYMEYL